MENPALDQSIFIWWRRRGQNGKCGNYLPNYLIKRCIHFFYPRPVLAFEYCHCLHLCVCVCLSVCLCVNHLLVRLITQDPFKLGSPNLDQRCKRPWLRSLLFWGAIDLDLQGQNLTSKSEFTPFWACPDHNSLPIQARITKFGPEVENSLVKVPIVFGGNWRRTSR